jgi:hypothetical protein
MAWRQKTLEVMADILRFTARGAILADLIALALASVWFVVKFLWFAIDWLSRTLFSSPWGSGG